MPRYVFAILGRDTEVARYGLQSMIGKLACREVVAQHGVERVDQLPARHDEADTTAAIPAAYDSAASGALAQARRTDSPEGERHSRDSRPAIEKGQIEPVEV